MHETKSSSKTHFENKLTLRHNKDFFCWCPFFKGDIIYDIIIIIRTQHHVKAKHLISDWSVWFGLCYPNTLVILHTVCGVFVGPFCCENTGVYFSFVVLKETKWLTLALYLSQTLSTTDILYEDSNRLELVLL